MPKHPKIRLDDLIVAHHGIPSLEEARSLIMQGLVVIGPQKAMKPGQQVPLDSPIRIIQKKGAYVSRGGDKLIGALESFSLSPEDRICLDIGISTGGFTHVLRTKGAKCVFGVDVGYGQVAMALQQDPDVIVLERTNARTLSKEMFVELVRGISPDHLASADAIDLVVMDVSFISVLKVLPSIKELVLPGADYLILVKPQFEADADEIESGGIVRDDAIRSRIVTRVCDALPELGFKCLNQTLSPIKGAKGNQEFWLHLTT